jgi:hypothetical protein
MSDFKAFARDFFTTLGAEVAERDGRLHVGLSGPLAAYYDREALTLTFKPHDPEGELVAYGSRAFEAMLDYMAPRGRHTAGRLSERDGAPTVVRLLNGTALAEGGADAPRWGYALNFHLTCLSDERSERLVTFCLDAEGRPSPELAQWLEAAPELTGVVGPAAIPPAVLNAAEVLALDEAERLAETLEAETLARLRQAATRLVGYYEDQMAEIPIRRRKGQSDEEAVESALQERMTLRAELARKLGEETARHQLRLQVRRISQAAVEVPGRWQAFRLQTPRAARSLKLWENRHTGTLEAPGCERCGTVPHGADGLCYGVCAEAHLVCEACLGRCGACGEDHCRSELTACHQCNEGACARCAGLCAEGHAVCATHLASCGCCGQAFCAGCLDRCPDCGPGGRLARRHGHPCAVCDRPVCEAHAVGCALCAQAVCQVDRAQCAGCGDGVCTSHMADCAHCELPYCTRCRDGGAACRCCGAVGQAVLPPEAWFAALDQVPTAGRYAHWLGIENDRYRYMLGRGLLGDLLVVTETDGSIVKVKEIGFWQKLFGWGG